MSTDNLGTGIPGSCHNQADSMMEESELSNSQKIQGEEGNNDSSDSNHQDDKCIALPLRFAVGDRVEAMMSCWESGTVIQHWDDGNPYRIRLDNQKVGDVNAPEDNDAYIRKPRNLSDYEGSDSCLCKECLAERAAQKKAAALALPGPPVDTGVYPPGFCPPGARKQGGDLCPTCGLSVDGGKAVGNGCTCPECVNKSGCKCGTKHAATAARERLRQKLNAKKKKARSRRQNSLPMLPVVEKVDKRAVDDLLSFIEGASAASSRSRSRSRSNSNSSDSSSSSSSSGGGGGGGGNDAPCKSKTGVIAPPKIPNSAKALKRERQRQRKVEQKQQKFNEEVAAEAHSAQAKATVVNTTSVKEADTKGASANTSISSLVGAAGGTSLNLEPQFEACACSMPDLLQPASTSEFEPTCSELFPSTSADYFDTMDEDDDFAAELEKFKSFIDQSFRMPTERQKVAINMGVIRTAVQKCRGERFGAQTMMAM